jgi:hypothetical protein
MFVTIFLRKHYTCPNIFGVVYGQNLDPPSQLTSLVVISFIHANPQPTIDRIEGYSTKALFQTWFIS